MSGAAVALAHGSSEADRASADSEAFRWSPLTRVFFRLAFCYFMPLCLMGGIPGIWASIPFVGRDLTHLLTLPISLLTEWTAQHVLHLTGDSAHPLASGSGDTAFHWLYNGVLALLAVLAASVWSVIDWRRPHYQILLAWMRFTLRLTLGIGMLQYGFYKVLPIQMQPPSLAVLNEPVGSTAPATLLWTLLGLNPLYEMICGMAEVAAGLLILFRRTALAGALLTAFVMANVVLYNFFFDVPVKLFASQLLLMALFVILPDLKTLLTIFWLHQPAVPRGVWVPPARRASFVRATAIVEAIFLVGAIWATLGREIPIYHRQLVAQRTVTPLRGGWHLTSALPPDGRAGSWPERMRDGERMNDLFVEMPTRANIHAGNGQLWRVYLEQDAQASTIRLRSENDEITTYRYALADDDHLVLTYLDGTHGVLPKLTFTRIPLPTSYPLLTRGLHLVTNYAYDR